MKTLNILTSDLSVSQRSFYLIRNANVIQQKDPNINIQVFVENLARACLRTNFAVMSAAEAWGEYNPCIATNISNAAKLMHYPLTSRKLFYIWDLEWLRGAVPKMNYSNYSIVYLSAELELVCRSQEHAALVENTFNREVKYIVPDFDINKLLEITHESK
jgi:hypothetical protein